MLLFYVRHGDPIYNPDSLTPLGQRQAEALAKRFAVYGLDEIYASSSNRAMLTAQPTCEILKLKPTILDWCSEVHTWDQMTIKDEEGNKEWGYNHPATRALFLSPEVRALGYKWYTHPAFEKYNFAYGVERVETETDNFLLSLGYRHDRSRCGYVAEVPNNKRIALFAHEGLGMSFLSALLDIPYNEFAARFGFGFTGMTVIEFTDVDGFCIPKVLQHSNDSHLYREGVGIKYHNRLPI